MTGNLYQKLLNLGPGNRKQQNGTLDYRQGRRSEPTQAIVIRKLGNLKKQNSSQPCDFIFKFSDASKGIHAHAA